MELPRPGQGDKVLFWKNYPISGDPQVGIVIRNGQNAQFVMVHTRSGPVYYNGVHWIHDEGIKTHQDWWTEGFWDFHPETSFMRDTLTQMERVSAKLHEHEAAIFVLQQQVGILVDELGKKEGKKERSPEDVQAAKDRMAKARAARKVKA